MGIDDVRAFPLFSHISDADVANLGGELQLRTYAPRQRIFEMGDPAIGLYFIKSGKVKIFRVSREGAEQVLGVFQDGEEFAIAAVFHGGSYPASAETIEASRIYFLERDALLRHIQREPELALRLLNSMSKKLQGLVSLIDSLSLKDARGRLARYLTTLLPPEPHAPLTVDLPMSKTLLSQHLGVKMETLSRTFRVLVNEGTLGSIKQGHIVIENVQAIYQAAGDEPE
jgi:CRP/FNR family transcriptional regulator